MYLKECLIELGMSTLMYVAQLRALPTAQTILACGIGLAQE